MSEFLEALWREPWWTFEPETAGFWGQLYRGFNIFEGTVWIVFALIVSWRYLRRGQSSWEIVYAIAFILFGLTDFREAAVQSAPLVLVKGIILILLLRLRHFVIKNCYTDAWY